MYCYLASILMIDDDIHEWSFCTEVNVLSVSHTFMIHCLLVVTHS